MKRIFTAKFVETATFVVIFSIPPAILEYEAGMFWWMILFYRAFNASINAVTLVYSEQFGLWLASLFPTFSKLLSEGASKVISSLAAVLLMQIPASALFLSALNVFVPAKKQAFTGPLLITTGLSLVIWAYELWACPFCERQIPWLARLMKDPVGTTGIAARDVAGHVARGTRGIHGSIKRRIKERKGVGSKSH